MGEECTRDVALKPKLLTEWCRKLSSNPDQQRELGGGELDLRMHSYQCQNFIVFGHLSVRDRYPVSAKVGNLVVGFLLYGQECTHVPLACERHEDS